MCQPLRDELRACSTAYLRASCPQPEGGFTVTSPVLPEWVTEGDTLEEAYANVSDALAAVIEIYADQGRPLPSGIDLPTAGQIVWIEAPVEVS